MELLHTYGKELVALLVPFITWVLNALLRAKARLVLASPHTFTFLVQQPLVDPQGKEISPTQTVNTRSTIVRNTGRDTASHVELVFNWKPLCINIWPPRHFQEHVESDNRYVLIFDSLAPGENIGCEYFSVNSELPSILQVRSDQCVAETIEMWPQPVLPQWQIRILQFLLFSGIALVVYVGILGLQFLILKTPFGH